MADALATPSSDDLATLDNVLEDGGTDGSTRRHLLSRAAAGAAAGGAVSLGVGTGVADAARLSTSTQDLLDTIATNEAFGTTFVSEAYRRAPGTPAAQFAPILGHAATQEFDHLRALRRLGAKPLAKRFWIPDAFFAGGGVGAFQAVAVIEVIEMSSYLAAVTKFARARRDTAARWLSEALANEAEHRVLARQALVVLGASTDVANDRSFETYTNRTAASTQRAVAKLGIGVGERTSKPGAFYDYPGDPSNHGRGLKPRNRTPD